MRTVLTTPIGWFSIPTREQVVEFVTTGKIEGQYE